MYLNKHINMTCLTISKASDLIEEGATRECLVILDMYIQDCIKEAVEEERKRSESALKEMMEKTLQEAKEKMKEQAKVGILIDHA